MTIAVDMGRKATKTNKQTKAMRVVLFLLIPLSQFVHINSKFLDQTVFKMFIKFHF